MVGGNVVVPFLDAHGDGCAVLLAHQSAAATFFQLLKVPEAPEVGVPQRDVVLQAGVAAQRPVAGVLEEDVVPELSAESQVDVRPLTSEQRDGWDESFGRVEIGEGGA